MLHGQSLSFCTVLQEISNLYKSSEVTWCDKGEIKGIPKCILQTDLQNKDLQAKAQGTVKAAVLEGDPDMEGLVALSVYDSKPTYFMSTVMEGIEWDVN